MMKAYTEIIYLIFWKKKTFYPLEQLQNVKNMK